MMLMSTLVRAWVVFALLVATSVEQTLGPEPTSPPTGVPNGLPQAPSLAPSSAPSFVPSTTSPTAPPSPHPSTFPIPAPTMSPSLTPTRMPSSVPTAVPTPMRDVAKPVILPTGGQVYISGTTVDITCDTPEAEVYYTTDGTTPTQSTGVKVPDTHTVWITQTGTVHVKARGFRTNFAPSSIATRTYHIVERAEAPAFTPSEGVFTNFVDVLIECDSPTAIVRYSTDDAEDLIPFFDADNVAFQQEHSDGYKGAAAECGEIVRVAAEVNGDVTLRAVALEQDKAPSMETVAGFILELKAATPQISPSDAVVPGPGFLIITTATPGADLYYTIDGSVPGPGEGVHCPPSVAECKVTISDAGDFHIRAIAMATGYSESDILEHTVTVKPLVSKPIFSPSPEEGGTGTNGAFIDTVSIIVSCDTPDAVIHYVVLGVGTVDGTDTPGPGQPNDVAISPGDTIEWSLLGTHTFRAVAVREGWFDSEIVDLTYTIVEPDYDVIAIPSHPSPLEEAYWSAATVSSVATEPQVSVESFGEILDEDGEVFPWDYVSNVTHVADWLSPDMEPLEADLRAVFGRVVSVANPLDHVSILAASDQCDALGLPKDTIAIATAASASSSSPFAPHQQHVRAIGATEMSSVDDIDMLREHAWRDAQVWAYFGEGAGERCAVMASGGDFDVGTGECRGHLVAGGAVLNLESPEAGGGVGGRDAASRVYMGKRNDTWVMGYVPQTEVVPQSGFEFLFAARMWLVRRGRNYVPTAVANTGYGSLDEAREVINERRTYRLALGLKKDGTLHFAQATCDQGLTFGEFADAMVRSGMYNAVSLGDELTSEAPFTVDGVPIATATSPCNGGGRRGEDLPTLCDSAVNSVLCVHMSPPPRLELDVDGADPYLKNAMQGAWDAEPWPWTQIPPSPAPTPRPTDEATDPSVPASSPTPRPSPDGDDDEWFIITEAPTPLFPTPNATGMIESGYSDLNFYRTTTTILFVALLFSLAIHARNFQQEEQLAAAKRRRRWRGSTRHEGSDPDGGMNPDMLEQHSLGGNHYGTTRVMRAISQRIHGRRHKAQGYDQLNYNDDGGAFELTNRGRVADGSALEDVDPDDAYREGWRPSYDFQDRGEDPGMYAMDGNGFGGNGMHNGGMATSASARSRGRRSNGVLGFLGGMFDRGGGGGVGRSSQASSSWHTTGVLGQGSASPRAPDVDIEINPFLATASAPVQVQQRRVGGQGQQRAHPGHGTGDGVGPLAVGSGVGTGGFSGGEDER